MEVCSIWHALPGWNRNMNGAAGAGERVWQVLLGAKPGKWRFAPLLRLLSALHKIGPSLSVRHWGRLEGNKWQGT